MNRELELNWDLYRKIFMMRESEVAIQKYYFDDDMKTPMHMSMGSEAVLGGICHALSDQDQAYGTYRTHALFLAKTEDIKAFFAELYGKENGTAEGKAGSMHLADPEKGLNLCSAIVSGTIGVAMGTAFANKYLKNQKISVAFFGDGAVEEGVFWETVNFSTLHKLPLLLICEDNALAVNTKPEKTKSYTDIESIIEKFGCEAHYLETTDVEEIYSFTAKLKKSILENPRPIFVRLRYHRYLQHVGIETDYEVGYRTVEEFEEWKKRDPIKVQREKLLSQYGVSDVEIEKCEKEILTAIESAVSHAKESAFCPTQNLFKGVFSCEQ